MSRPGRRRTGARARLRPLALLVCAALAPAAAGAGSGAGPAPGAGDAPSAPAALTADDWCSRVAQALRTGIDMAAHGRMHVRVPGEPDLRFVFDMLRQPWREGTRTVFEMREEGDSRSVVSELVVEPDAPMVNWYWDLRQRRWLAVRGLLATDPFADSLFRHEDLWLTDPAARRRGAVREVEEDGRRFVELESEPYHYYLRVVTRIDPETALPVRVRFYDNTGAPIREQHFESVELVDGRPFPKVIRLRDLVGGAESTMTYEEVDFPKRAIPPSFFDLSFMHNRITKGADPVPLDAVRASGAGGAQDPAGI